VRETHDPFTNKLGHIPFTEEVYAAAATVAARWIRSVRTKPRKVIVLDCDNTLWQGICGEGPVQLTPPYRKLHEFMLRQRDEGVLLAIASKNNEDDVIAVLESKDCALKLDHFTSWQINWQAKSENLKTISEELSLALNSFLFLDDSPYECLEVRNSCPEVLTVPLPQDPEAIPAFLEHMWAFDRPAATDEDRNRASMYAAERQRTDLSKRALTREEFLASLKIEIQIARAAEADLARVAQLAHRTTQFNMTGLTHTVQSLTTKLSQEGSECWTARVCDVFGDYGLVGAIVFDATGNQLRVDTFLLSCRALGRGVEERMMDDLKLWAVERGAESVVIPFVPTARNRPALDFLSRYCDVSADAKARFECVLSASGAASEWHPTEAPTPASMSASAATPAPVMSDEAELLARIAGELQTVEAILGAVRNQIKHRPADAGPFVTPQSGVEESLARIWSECLAVEPIGATDNFFDFGGQSLIATRILARVRTEFGVEMSLTNFFERPTVKQMAAFIVQSIQGSVKTGAEAISRQNGPREASRANRTLQS
jgi:FkbH-like protein